MCPGVSCEDQVDCIALSTTQSTIVRDGKEIQSKRASRDILVLYPIHLVTLSEAIRVTQHAHPHPSSNTDTSAKHGTAPYHSLAKPLQNMIVIKTRPLRDNHAQGNSSAMDSDIRCKPWSGAESGISADRIG